MKKTKEEITEECLQWLDLESGSAKIVQGETLEKLKSLLGITWDDGGEIYCNKTSILFTDPDDYEQALTADKKLIETIRVEIKNMNLHLFVVEFVNSKLVNELLMVEEQIEIFENEDLEILKEITEEVQQ